MCKYKQDDTFCLSSCYKYEKKLWSLIYRHFACNENMTCQTSIILSEQGAKEVYAGDHRRDSFHQAPTPVQLRQTPTPQAKSDHPSHSNYSSQRPLVVGTARRPISGQEQGHAATPVVRKARRKFPGPAGLLPRLVRRLCLDKRVFL